MKDTNRILEKIKKIVIEKEPLAKIYLYGSRARGTSNVDSDWDILILLKKDRMTLEIENDITSPLYDLEFDTGEVISPMIYLEDDWFSKYRITPFFQNVMREGMLL